VDSIHHNDSERVKIFTGCPICKLTRASAVIEACWKYLQYPATFNDEAVKARDQALALIKEFRGGGE
jgi:hypothetical protein